MCTKAVASRDLEEGCWRSWRPPAWRSVTSAVRMARPSTALRARLAGRATADADLLLRLELGDLPEGRRAATAAFVGARVGGMPSPMAAGVGTVATALAVASAALGRGRVIGLVAKLHPPLAGEYLRLLRSLAYAYVWETWPDTAHDGAPRGIEVTAAGEIDAVAHRTTRVTAGDIDAPARFATVATVMANPTAGTTSVGTVNAGGVDGTSGTAEGTTESAGSTVAAARGNV